jgi:sporulation protein YlmC with PRC-barrel domain
MNKHLTTTAIAAVLGIGLLTAPISFAPHDAAAATAATAAGDAQKLIGQNIENASGETVGEVESVVIDGDGTVQYVIAGVGGFLGLGEKHVALHWDELTISENGDKVMANVTKEQLEALPEHKFPENAKPGMVYSYDDDVAVNPYIAERTPPAPAASTTEQAAADSTTTATPEVAPPEAAIDPAAGIPGMRASEIIGAKVNTADGTNIGEISEVIVQSNGSINGVVIDVGGFLGLGEKPVLLGWNDLSFAGDANDVVVSTALSKEQLNSMPAYKTM